MRDEQLIEVGNAWRFIVSLLPERPFSTVLLLGHPGKLAKLAAGEWDTHSSRSRQATEYLGRLCPEVLDHPAPESTTAEGLFAALPADERKTLADELANRVRSRIEPRRQSLGRGRVFDQHGRGMSGNRRRSRTVAMNPAEKEHRRPAGPPTPPAPLPLAGEGRARLWIVGCGPGSARYLTDAAREAAAAAEVLVGGRRLLELFPDAAAEQIVVGADIANAIEQIVARHAVGQRVVVLVSGDPGLYSLAQNVIRRVGRQCCEVVPGVSSVQVAFARLAMDWSDARILSAHGRIPAITADELAAADKVAILAGTKDSLRWSAAMTASLEATHAAFLGENLTLPGERFEPLTAAQLAVAEASSPSIVLLIRKALLA